MKKIFLFLFFGVTLFAQSQSVELGGFTTNIPQKASIYDISDPKAINIKVSVWGAVKTPGYYIVPDYTNIPTLLSLAGGPSETSKLEDMRLFRQGKDTSKTELIFINYDNLLWGKDLRDFKPAPKLLSGDILLIPAEPKFFLKDYLFMGLSASATIFSILTLIVQLKR
jgi:hypothetical protein